MTGERLNDVAVLILRAAAGVIFLAHGLQKLGLFGGSGIDGLAGLLRGMNFMAPVFWAWLVAITETLGGLFLILGVFPRISAALITVVMLVAIVKVHGANGFFMMRGGFEYQFLIIAVCIYIMLMGGGKLSLYDKF